MSGGRIIYTLVARGVTILAEYTGQTGNFQKVTRSILERIPKHDGKMSYAYDAHFFHYVVEDEIIYMCMADESYPRRVAYQFLDNIQQRFRRDYGDKGKTALPLQFNEDFSRVLQKQMDYYNNSQVDKIQLIREQVETATNVMVANIDRVLERGEKIDLLVDKTQQIADDSYHFKRQSTSLKRSMWCKNFKLTLMVIVAILVLIFIIFLFACNGFKCTQK
eukprot:NODE_6124_length_923_cov_37.455000_g5533_i0.p1 GENE.NODE_6124_length_923_cov_37.455000_g5533_i0~~NODE_6124_length_923_cov_37.455000_g5533_i0.p1  ORF type:complete len:220 (-),score=13.87 NODE_6124_length_923_cov_37.455000_g5533_i0:211-870(-)